MRRVGRSTASLFRLQVSSAVMQTLGRMFTGSHEGYNWVVTPTDLPTLPELTVQSHLGLHLCITSFDSGPPRPNEEEIALGWRLQGEVMVSPPLTASLAIPFEQYDEWYILPNPAFHVHPVEVFVNYGAFTLVSPKVLDRGREPTWERNAHAFLIPMQERFWSQLKTTRLWLN